MLKFQNTSDKVFSNAVALTLSLCMLIRKEAIKQNIARADKNSPVI